MARGSNTASLFPGAYSSNRQERARNRLKGMDPRLLTMVNQYTFANSTTISLSEEDEDYLRRATHHYTEAIHKIKDLYDANPNSLKPLFAHAHAALLEIPEDSPKADGPHVSVQMCIWIVGDYFKYLADIIDAENDRRDEAKIVIEKVFKRAFAKVELR